jgi:predicted nuclease of predicted toxin-antitoxin system
LTKVALDEGVPEQIADHLPGYDVQSVRQLGLIGTKNGNLLDAIAAKEFRAFITNDKRMEREQTLDGRPFAILLLRTNHWPTIEPNVGALAAALNEAATGAVFKVDCGTFVPRRFRKRLGPV